MIATVALIILLIHSFVVSFISFLLYKSHNEVVSLLKNREDKLVENDLGANKKYSPKEVEDMFNDMTKNEDLKPFELQTDEDLKEAVAKELGYGEGKYEKVE